MGNRCCAASGNGTGANMDEDLRFTKNPKNKQFRRYYSHLPDSRQINGGPGDMMGLDRPAPIMIRSVQLINKERFLAEYDFQSKKSDTTHQDIIVINADTM